MIFVCFVDKSFWRCSCPFLATEKERRIGTEKIAKLSAFNFSNMQ